MKRLTYLNYSKYGYEYGYKYAYKDSKYTQTFKFLNKPTTRQLITEINLFKKVASTYLIV